VVLFSLAIPLLGLYRFFVSPIDAGRTPVEVIAISGCLPLQAWLVVSATREYRTKAERWVLAFLFTGILIVALVVGVGWFGMFYVLAALTLVIAQPPISYGLFALLLLTPAALAQELGHPEWGTYFMLGVILTGLPMAVVILLIRAVRQLRRAEIELAEEAVTRERMRIDRELQSTVGSALQSVAEQGDRAAMWVELGRPGAAAQIRTVVHTSREALAAARRLVSQYRDTSFRAELNAAIGLLRAAGIATQLEGSSDVPPTAGGQARAQLRDGVARLLAAGEPARKVTINVMASDAGVRVDFLPSDGEPR